MQSWLWIALLIAGTAGIGILFLRSYLGEAAVFVVEHRMQFPGTREAAWAALTRADLFDQWNPYVKKMEGELRPGETLRVTIVQENWKLPIVVRRILPQQLLFGFPFQQLPPSLVAQRGLLKQVL